MNYAITLLVVASFALAIQAAGCPPPSYFTLGYSTAGSSGGFIAANPSGSNSNGLNAQYGLGNFAGLLVANSSYNQVIQTYFTLTSPSTSAAGGQYGAFEMYIGDSDLITTSLNGVPSKNIFAAATATTPSTPYGFSNAVSSVTGASAVFFSNGNQATNGYLLTITITTTGACSTTNYSVNLYNPSFAVAAVAGDPQFMGLRGQNYQIHGIDGAVYNIISDEDAQINSRFVFLTGPRPCPIMPSTGKKASACWTHPGSYLGEIGIKNAKGDRFYIQSGAAASGFNAVTLNGVALVIGSNSEFANFTSTHEVVISVGSFIIELENSDNFINLRSVKVVPGPSKLNAHGLLGQTWRNKVYNGKVKEIEGEVDDYLVGEDCVFGDDFLFNKFSSA